MAVGNVLAELLVKVKADTSELNKGLADAQSQAQGFGSSLGSLAAKILTVAAVAGAVTAVANAFKEAVFSAVEYGHTVEKMASNLRISTDAVQGLLVAAQIADVDIGSLSNTFRILNTHIADASVYGSKSARAFQDLGLSFQQLQSMTPVERFTAVVNAVSALEDPILRDAYATDLLGRSGAGAVERFKELADKMTIATQVGAVMSTASVQQLSVTDEKLKTLGIAWDGMWKKAGDYIATSMGLNNILTIITFVISKVNDLLNLIDQAQHAIPQLQIGGLTITPPSTSGTVPNQSYYPGQSQGNYYSWPKMASGGIVTKPTMAMVGESGPEAIVPLSQMGGNNITIQAGAFMGSETDARRFARIILDLIREDNRIRTVGRNA